MDMCELDGFGGGFSGGGFEAIEDFVGGKFFEDFF